MNDDRAAFGGEYAPRTEGGVWYVPKKDLVSAVRLLLDGGRLAWPVSMPEAQVLKQELRNFRTKIGPTLHESSSHREGEHNDLLLTLACALWATEHSIYSTDDR